MIIEASQDVPHIQHVIGYIDARDDQRNEMVYLRLPVLSALFLSFLTLSILIIGDESHLGSNSKVAHTEQQHFVQDFFICFAF